MIHAEEHGTFQSGGLTLHYLAWGRHDAPAMIMLHGLRSYGATWEPVVRALHGDWRVYALDQRGRGDSDWDAAGNYYSDAYVADLEAMATHLGLARFALVGHSMGGSNALVYAGTHPEQVSALVLEDIGPGSSAQSQGAGRIIDELRRTPQHFTDWAAARAFWRAQRPQISEEALDSRLRYSLKELPSGLIVWKHDAAGIARARTVDDPRRFVDLWPHVRRVACPALLVHGAQSDFLSADTAQAMVDTNANFSCRHIEGASHYVHDDRLDAFMAALNEFVDGLQAEGAAA